MNSVVRLKIKVKFPISLFKQVPYIISDIKSRLHDELIYLQFPQQFWSEHSRAQYLSQKKTDIQLILRMEVEQLIKVQYTPTQLSSKHGFEENSCFHSGTTLCSRQNN